jgi:peptide-methionine (S)-S-oxide reductase
MKTCCSSNTSDKECVRKSDGKVFKLPRRFSKKKCKQGIKGFTMRSSCAPYKDCLTKTDKRKKIKRKKVKRSRGGKLTYKKNMLGKKIKVCSKNPMTGFYRDGYCMTGSDDSGTHTVCAKMDKTFLDYTSNKGNDLSSVVEPGDKWCLCEYRWQEAFKDGVAPEVVQNATNMRTKDVIRKQIKTHNKKKSKPVFKDAYFAGGCFWGLQKSFNGIEGIEETTVGYMDPNSSKKGKTVTYEYVSTGKMGYAETVKVKYNSTILSFDELVELFFSFHDPTTLNRQGNDVGTQYRSIAFYSNKSEKNAIDNFIKNSDKNIVTEVKKKTTFHVAEDYHQNYLQKYTGGVKRTLKRLLPQLREIDKSKKEHIYKLSDPHKKRVLAIDEGIRDEMRKGVSRRDAALSKKKRFNVLRLYRKNNDPKGCKRLTQDMKYMDKKYDTGQTNNICK